MALGEHELCILLIGFAATLQRERHPKPIDSGTSRYLMDLHMGYSAANRVREAQLTGQSR
jgi:hypothetical protein